MREQYKSTGVYEKFGEPIPTFKNCCLVAPYLLVVGSFKFVGNLIEYWQNPLGFSEDNPIVQEIARERGISPRRAIRQLTREGSKVMPGFFADHPEVLNDLSGEDK